VRTLDWSACGIRLIDQNRLPDEELFLMVREVDELVAHIQSLAVRGAMALGVAGALGMALAAVRAKERGEDLDAALDEAATKLSNSRPTAVNLSIGVENVARARREGAGVAELVEVALAMRDADIEANLAIGLRGAELLRGARRILTHCNAGALAGVEHGTALSVVMALQREQPLDVVYVCETRPLLQGVRLTAWELARGGVEHRVIVDAAAAGLMLGGEVDAVVVGADRIAANGDVANKVGSLSHALAAHRAGIPFVVAAPEDTIDAGTASGADIPIEYRSESEVLTFEGREIGPPKSKALNPAFDVTPADLVTAVVTQRRTILPATDQVAPALPHPDTTGVCPSTP